MAIIFFGVLSLSVFAAGEWVTDFEQARKESCEKQLPILVDFSGSDWCGFCQKLDAEVFQTKEFLAYAKDNLILFLADFPKKKKQTSDVKKQNLALQSKYKIGGYPTVLLLDVDGSLIADVDYQGGGAVNYVEHLKDLLKLKPKQAAQIGKKTADKEAGSAAAPGVFIQRESGMVTNSLKMQFVPVQGTEVLFSIWETRVRDYETFVQMTGRKWRREALYPGSTAVSRQRPSHPVVNVSWDDAKTFCAWLTDKEQLTGKIRSEQQYRLPYDREWSAAAGLKEENEGLHRRSLEKLQKNITGAGNGRRRQVSEITVARKQQGSIRLQE